MRVLDLSSWRPMPHATQILADLGAEVLKVEPPGGDPMRGYPEIFASVARGKRSIVLDLKREHGRQRALELASEADVVCEAWRPGVADRLGIGYDVVAARNPSVIYCSLTGYGQDGPLRDTPGHDLNFQALAGAVAPRSPLDHDPEVPRLPVADLESGTLSALVICAAWGRRLTSGTGERIDIAMADVVAWWTGPRTGTARAGVENGAPFASPGYGLFRTRDDAWIALGALGEPRLWAAICSALGVDDLASLTFDAQVARTDEINQRLAGAIAQLDRETALARLDSTGAPVSPVLIPEEAARHPQFRARGFGAETSAGPVVVLPVKLDGTGPDAGTALPSVGEHPDGFSVGR